MLGPNVYVAPPGAFTAFHLDGGGTVDSGHQTVTGLNEVFMLRRLGPQPTEAAMEILRGGTAYGLRNLAHDEGEKPPWPGAEAVRHARDASGCRRGWGAGKGVPVSRIQPSPPADMSLSRFILYPGDYLHIGKGRLHAFRKLSPLAPVAAHFVGRDARWLDIIRDATGFEPLTPPLAALAARSAAPGAARPSLPLSPWQRAAPPGNALGVCISIAWDWAYMGSTLQVRARAPSLPPPRHARIAAPPLPP